MLKYSIKRLWFRFIKSLIIIKPKLNFLNAIIIKNEVILIYYITIKKQNKLLYLSTKSFTINNETS